MGLYVDLADRPIFTRYEMEISNHNGKPICTDKGCKTFTKSEGFGYGWDDARVQLNALKDAKTVTIEYKLKEWEVQK